MKKLAKFVLTVALVLVSTSVAAPQMVTDQSEDSIILSSKGFVRIQVIVSNKKADLKENRFDKYVGFISLDKIVERSFLSCIAEKEGYKIYVQFGKTVDLMFYDFGLNISERSRLVLNQYANPSIDYASDGKLFFDLSTDTATHIYLLDLMHFNAIEALSGFRLMNCSELIKF